MRDMQMFSQVTKTSAIREHTIHYDTIFDFGTTPRLEDFFFGDFFDFRPEALSSYKEPSVASVKSISETTPTRLERS
jgi:hypothetical protein